MQSKFFTLSELTRSDAATRHGIANQPDPVAANNLQRLCAAVLDPLRESVGSAININSGYRGPELNAKIGGATKSQHKEGNAADIQARAISVLELFKTVIRLNLPFDQVIYEAKNRTTKWVHVSHDPARARGAILVADFGDDGRVARYRTITAQQALELGDEAMRDALPELEYEEMHDEPEDDEATDDEASDASVAAPVPAGRPAVRRPVRRAKARRPATRRATARKSPVRSAKRKAPASKKTASRKKSAAGRKKAKSVVKARARKPARRGK